MNLKEAFRYQNFLDKTIGMFVSQLSYRPNVVKTSQFHKRNLANADAENETIDTTAERAYSTSPENMIHILALLLEEKEACCASVTAAKYDYNRKMGFDLDAQLAVNKRRQEVARVLNTLGYYKETKNIVRGTGYKFNNEGVQTPYYYDIEETSTPDFDAQFVREEGKRLMRFADEVSSAADQCMIESVLDFVPTFNPTDSVEDVIETAERKLGLNKAA